MGSPATIVSSGTVTAPTGQGGQRHTIFAANSGLWWHLFIDSTNTSSLKSESSPDATAGSWTPRATGTLPTAHSGEGRDFSVAYASLGATDVVHISISITTAGVNYAYYVRATISGTTLTFGSFTKLESSGGISGGVTDGAALHPGGADVVIDSNGRPIHLTSSGIDAAGDAAVYRATNADSGTWTAGYPVGTQLDSGITNNNNGCHVENQGSGHALALWENGAAAETSSMTNVRFSYYNGTSWSTAANVFASALGAGVDPNNFGCAATGTTSSMVVLRSTSTVLKYRPITSGTAGAESTVTVTGITGIAAGKGLACYWDAINSRLYVFFIDTDAAQSVKYVTWTSGGGWNAAAQTLEGSTQTRNFISVSQQPDASGNIGVVWSQTNGANQDNVIELLSTTGTNYTNLERGIRGLNRGLALAA